MTDILEQKIAEADIYFKKNNIPFFRIKTGPQKHLTKFYVPGGYISFLSKGILTHSRESTDKFYNNLDQILSDIPKNVKIYLFLHNLEDTSLEGDEYKELYNTFEEEFGLDQFGDGIQLITNFDQIVIKNAPYAVEMPHILRSLKANPIVDIFENEKLICDEYAYNRFLAVSNQEAIDTLNKKYQLEVLETEDMGIKYPFRKALSFKGSTKPSFHRFHFNVSNYLENIYSIEKPLREIQGVSHICVKCNSYYFVRKDENPDSRDKCFKCIREERNEKKNIEN